MHIPNLSLPLVRVGPCCHLVQANQQVQMVQLVLVDLENQALLVRLLIHFDHWVLVVPMDQANL